MSAAKSYPLVKVSGSPAEMGYQHGRAVPERVHRFVEMLVKAAGGKREEVMARTKVFLPLFEQHCPRLLDEVRGLAEGAQISFEEALLLQIRGEVAKVRESACTAFALSGKATASGQILIGQNSDMGKEQEDVAIVLHLTPDKGPKILMWTFAGHIGYHGVNEAGVAHFANALGGGPKWRLALPHYPVKRAMLEQTTVAEVVKVFDTMPVCSSGNYVLCGGCKTICDVELTPEGYALLHDEGEGFIVHSNHFISPKFRTPDTDAKSLPDSFHRLERLRSLVQAERGRISVETMKRFLSDHSNYPNSICRHSESMKTVASLIAEPEAGRFHVCCGNPCEGQWQSYAI